MTAYSNTDNREAQQTPYESCLIDIWKSLIRKGIHNECEYCIPNVDQKLLPSLWHKGRGVQGDDAHDQLTS